jgi:protein-disulfide isomerase
MSARTAQKKEARQARIALEAERERIARRRLQWRRLAAIVVVAGAVVAVAVAVSSGRSEHASAATGGRVSGAAFSRDLFAGISQRGTRLGNPSAPVRLVEFADLQCPYCDEYTVQALPTLVKDYVRTGKLQMEFENLSFIGPDSVKAGRVAAAASQQNRLWNFVDLLYLNQGTENTGYVTAAYLRRLLNAVAGLNVPVALHASETPAADAALAKANQAATQEGVSGTPTFLIGRTGGGLHPFQPASLTPAPFAAKLEALLGRGR